MKNFKKLSKAVAAVLAVLLICWCAVFFADYSRVSSLKEPIFAKTDSSSGTMSTTLKGIGYRIDITYYFAENGEREIQQTAMYLFDSLVAAAIT